MPRLVRALDIQLDESAGEFFILPRRGCFTGTKPNDRIVDADRLSGLELEIANDAVALVQEAKDRNPLRHGGDARPLSGAGIGRRNPRAVGLLLPLIPTPAPRKQQERRARNGELSHLSPESMADSRRWPRGETCLSTGIHPDGRRPSYR